MTEGVRHNAGKPRWSLLPWDALSVVLAVSEHGLKKYPPRNWEKGLVWCEVFDSLQRHLTAWYGGEERDPESGLPHLGHAAWNALALLALTSRGAGKDDRPK